MTDWELNLKILLHLPTRTNDRIGGFFSDHYTDVLNGNGSWDDIEWHGNSPTDYDGWFDYHINETNKYVNPVFDELAQNHIIAETGLFPNLNDDRTGTGSLFARYDDGTFKIVGDMSGDWGTATDVVNNPYNTNFLGHYSTKFYEDLDGDGYADNITTSGNHFNVKDTPTKFC